MKDKNIAAVLALLFGSVGAHRFYLGQVGMGILYFMFCWTFIPSLVSFVEFIGLALMDSAEFNRRYNSREVLQQPVVVQMLPPGPAGYPPHGYGAPRPWGAPATPDLGTQLQKLHELHVAGLLTDDEFAKQKAKLLDSM